MGAPNSTRLIGVQYARAAAALAVVAYHACQRVDLNFDAGARGVDVFFVISGFIMWAITADRDTRPFAFIANRVVRIVPLYWIATAVVIVASLSGLASGQNDLTASSIAKSLLFIPYIPEGGTYAWPILTPGWTLNFEMFFYLVFAGFLFSHSQWRLWGLSATFAALVILGAVFPPSGAVFETYTSPLILMFLAGIWLAELIRRGLALPRIAAAASIAIGGAALLLVPGDLGPVTVTAVGAAAFALVAGVACLDHRHAVTRWKIPELLGDASYSIYLWHGVALTIAAKAADVADLPAFATVIIGISGGVVAGVLSYWLIEAPLLKLLRPKPRQPAIPISAQ